MMMNMRCNLGVCECLFVESLSQQWKISTTNRPVQCKSHPVKSLLFSSASCLNSSMSMSSFKKYPSKSKVSFFTIYKIYCNESKETYDDSRPQSVSSNAWNRTSEVSKTTFFKNNFKKVSVCKQPCVTDTQKLKSSKLKLCEYITCR